MEEQNALDFPEIRACPFCGGKAHFEVVYPHKHSSLLKKLMGDVELPDCEGEAFIFCDSCSAAISGKDVEDVARKWNARINESFSNGDRLRAMFELGWVDESLAETLSRTDICLAGIDGCSADNCYSCWIKWLREKAKA